MRQPDRSSEYELAGTSLQRGLALKWSDKISYNSNIMSPRPVANPQQIQ